MSSVWLKCLLALGSTVLPAEGWFLGGMMGCPNNCPPAYSGLYQNQNSYQAAPQMSFPSSAMNSYAMPPQQYAIAPPPPPPAYALPPPQQYPTPPPVYATPPPVYVTPPPPKCFINSDGFKCCSRELDEFLSRQVVEMLRPGQRRCNMQRLSTNLAFEAQRMFNHSMESVVASGDIQNLSSYPGNLYCKKRSADGKIVVLYGSATPYSLEESGARPLTPEEIRAFNYPASYSEINYHDGNEQNIQS